MIHDMLRCTIYLFCKVIHVIIHIYTHAVIQIASIYKNENKYWHDKLTYQGYNTA